MRELRLYVIEGDEPAGRWRIVDRTALEVADGEVWVTIEGRIDDHWLARHARLGQRGGARRDVRVRSARRARRARRAGVVAAARRMARRPASRARIAADVAPRRWRIGVRPGIARAHARFGRPRGHRRSAWSASPAPECAGRANARRRIPSVSLRHGGVRAAAFRPRGSDGAWPCRPAASAAGRGSRAYGGARRHRGCRQTCRALGMSGPLRVPGSRRCIRATTVCEVPIRTIRIARDGREF